VNRRRLTLVVLGCVSGLVLQIGVLALVVKARGDDYPSSWDPRVADLVGFVERARGHDFRHPVPVSFLTDEEYGARTRTDSATLTDEDRESIAQDEAIFRALGLIDADVDLLEAQNDLTDAGTLAFYDPAEEEIVVRGNELTPDLRVTLVHELTHTLQDQTFPIEGRGPRRSRAASPSPTPRSWRATPSASRPGTTSR
jgi:hypothetical protein